MCQCDNEEIKAKAKTKDKEEVQALWIIHYLQNPKPETQNAERETLKPETLIAFIIFVLMSFPSVFFISRSFI